MNATTTRPGLDPSRSAASLAAWATTLALAGAAWLVWLAGQPSANAAVRHGPHGLAAWVMTSLLALPLIIGGVWVATQLSRFVRTALGATPLSRVLHPVLVSATAAVGLGVGWHLQTTFAGADPPARRLLTAVVLVSPATLVTTLLVASVVAGLTTRSQRLRRPSPRRLVASLSGALVVLSTAALPLTQAESAAAAANSPCPVGATQKTFDVQAIDVDMPLNRFGDHDPNGRMYVLSDKVAAVRAEESSQHVSIGLRDDAIQPLVVRANGGDCVTITYTDNASGGDFGLHIDGLAFDATSSGDAVGNNPSSVPASGETQTYTYYVPRDPTLEGAHYLHPGPGFRDFVNHGLFGSLVVEPPGSTYLDPNAPDEAHAHALESGWEAIIRPALGAEFRENVQLYHEIGNENEKNAVLQSNGEAVPFVDPHTDAYRPDTRAINYRSEGFYDRLEEAPDQEAHGYGSYTFGDVATPMPRGYQADPTKFRILHAGGEMFHVFHMHGGGIRWRMNPVADPTWDYGDTGLDKHPLPLTDSERLDSQAFGPGESYNLEIEGGAGGVQQGAGDFLFHCHIAEHYVAGMWSFWRVYDTAQSNFAPLADRVAPPAPVDSTELVGRTYDGQTITEANLDDWVRPQLPPQGVRHNHLDAAVWNWSTNPNKPTQYLGEPEDTRHPDYADYYRTVPGHPTALPDDTFVGHRPVIKFNPLNGRPAFPLLRPHLGMRPPFAPNGHSGAPYLGEMGDQPAKAGASIDPWAGRADGICPAKQADGSPTQLRRFNVVAIQRAVQVTPKDVDPTGMIYSLAHDKRAVMRGAKPFEPLALRTNAGECDAVTLTNALKDPEQQVNIHIHHVQFDTQASDGVITGMSYEQAVYPYKAHDPQLTREAVAGSRVLHLSDVTKFHLGSSIGVGLGTEGPAAHGTANAALSGQGPEIRTITAIHPGTRTVRLNAPLVADHRAGQFAGTEFVQYRWYPDVDLDNIFFHDHVDGIHTFAHGLVGQLITEPQGSTYHDPRTGRQIDSGTIADIHTSTPLSVPAGVTGSFRELALWTMDKGFGSTTDSMLNLRANPLVDRQGLNPSQRFSSYRWGDPMTPLPRAYPGDPFVIRTVNVGPTVDTLHIDGHQFSYENRYADAAGDPEATTMNTLHYGISEKYTLILNGGAGGTTQTPGDYLYFNGIDRRLVDGAWGIIRVLAGQVSTDHADPNFLQPLPGRTVAQAAPLPTRTGSASPKAPNTGDPCPTGAPVHHFDITAVRVPDAPNPARYAYVPSGQAAAVLAGRLRPEPLVMHVQRGECVTVLMRNSTKEASVGFHLSGLDSGIASSGVAVGFNPSTAVADGATGLYRYYVGDSRLSGGVIGDLAGSQTAKRGLYGSYTVEPSGTVTTDPRTGEPTDVGSAVDVHEPNGPNYRDFTLALADDDPQMGASFMPYPVNVERPEAVLVNYRRTPRNDRLADAFSSLTFGDPQTPILSAYAGDPMVVHTMVTPGSEQMHSFNLGGLRFAMDSRIVDGNTAETRGVGPWEYSTSQLVGGAGGGRAGDYFYGDMRRVFTKAGMWGLQRVLPPPLTCPTDGAELRCLDGTDTAAGTP